MRTILGIVRFTLLLIAFFVGGLSIAIASLLPIRLHGVKLALWMLTYLARIMLWIMNVRIRIADEDLDRLRTHEGFIFPNHVSYLDPFIVSSITPARYLSTIEVKTTPILGWVAKGVETVFVDRSNKTSRLEARNALSHHMASYHPPIVLFPEGGIKHPSDNIGLFRHGAFEIVVDGEIPFMPCVFFFHQGQTVFWTKEIPLWLVIWQVVSSPEPIRIDVQTLPPVMPTVDDDPKLLADVTRDVMLNKMNQFILQSGL